LGKVPVDVEAKLRVACPPWLGNTRGGIEHGHRDTKGLQGLGRGAKDKDERLGPAALLAHAGKRARKGRKLDGFPKPRRLSAG
jgi:hypothetical protein